MKRIFEHIKFQAAVMTILAVVSCEEVKPDNEGVTDKPSPASTTVTATIEPAKTKVTFSSNSFPSLEWRAGDRISVLGEKTGNQIFIAQSSGLEATFKGTLDLNDKVLYGIYPYNENYSTESTDIIIPAVQQATAGSFDPKAFVATAESADMKFTFKPSCSFFKFRFEDAANVKSVKIIDNNDGRSITVSEAKGNQQFTSKTDYFAVAYPDEYIDGVTFMITYDNGKLYTRNFSEQIFEGDSRNMIHDFGKIDTEGEWLTIMEQVLDFSYAGYRHGEEAPEDVSKLGYTLYDVTAYGAVPNDGKSDRTAILKALDAALGSNRRTDSNGWIIYPAKAEANAIIYFPEGEFIMYSEEDDKTTDGKSPSIVIPAGNFVIKGAGRDKTAIIMTAPMEPKSESQMYSSPEMIQIKHNSGMSNLTELTGSKAAKGTFSVEVKNTAGIGPGDWICLYLLDNNETLVNQEIAPYTQADGNFSLNGKPTTWDIITKGVEIYDYHQVKAVEGNKVTFHEPLMHEVDPQYKWVVKAYPHYENVGVEDVTFKGNAPKDFTHHGSWLHDGGYKPISMMRVTDSWIRRVGFEDTSEGFTVTGSANVSAYDIVMRGENGHSSVRSQASSRVLIAATVDNTADGGNFHGVGVSKHAMGTVLWRNKWGESSCFESHANQPRATLIDCCTGGWHKGHMGGNANEAPHHLADLTIWNFYATECSAVNFSWWETGSWRFLPPVIVGFRSADGVTFNSEEVICDLYHGTVPAAESLYEYQLERRLGYLPQWINELKSYTNNLF